MDEKTLAENRKKRGEVSEEFVNQFYNLNSDQLCKSLQNSNAQIRSSAAIILGNQKDQKYVQLLINRLKIEKALYVKINLCNSIVNYGITIIPDLLELLGTIGINQHYDLPEKGFYKSNYPLPRDIIARIIIRMGEDALVPLAEFVKNRKGNILLEAIDVIGHISYYSKNISLEKVLINLYKNSDYNFVLKWKIIRSFQGFNTTAVQKILLTILSSEQIKQFKWEALRVLLIQNKLLISEIENLVLNSGDEEFIKTLQCFS